MGKTFKTGHALHHYFRRPRGHLQALREVPNTFRDNEDVVGPLDENVLTVSQVRSVAVRNRAVPPDAWDDESIDRSNRVVYSAASKMIESGLTPEAAARRLVNKFDLEWSVAREVVSISAFSFITKHLDHGYKYPRAWIGNVKNIFAKGVS